MEERTGVKSPAGRLDWVDAARGASLAAMVWYHLIWDLSYFGLAGYELFGDPFWLAVRAAILSAFLLIAGYAMALRVRAGKGPPPAMRIGVIALAACFVTAASLVALPDMPILFGVLHCIAVGAVLLAPVARAPVWVAWATAAVPIAFGPIAFGAIDPGSDAPAFLAWIGVGPSPRPSADFVPVLPWIGVIALGLALGRSAPPLLGHGWRAPRILIWAGRRSLPIYLIHQPALIAAVAAVAWLSGQTLPWDGQRRAFQRAFTLECEAGYRASGAASRPADCHCVLDKLVDEFGWERLSGGLSAGDFIRLEAARAACDPAGLNPTE